MLVRQHAQYELKDGSVSDPIRVIFADKVALDRAARNNGWDLEKNFTAVNSLLAWHAAKRVGATSLGYDEFVEELVDVVVERDGDVDPTQPDRTDDSPSL